MHILERKRTDGHMVGSCGDQRGGQSDGVGGPLRGDGEIQLDGESQITKDIFNF